MQLRFATQAITGEDYVSSRLWERARIKCCPVHPQGGCGFAAHGTYARASPPGTRIRRWYCPRGRVTFSALPDCLNARLSGTLASVEREVLLVEAAPSLAAAVREERPQIGLPGVLRYFARRASRIRCALRAIRGLYPDPFAGVDSTLAAFTLVLDAAGPPGLKGVPPPPTASALVWLRAIASRHLAMLPAPLGFDPAPVRARQPGDARQHRTGADRPVVVLEAAGSPGQSP